ncbi:cyanate permease [Pseudonocardia parietis]|uniref:Cyanate permease n=1 Tax=Pseudonocardia parietis TaxID=570936 RepID=A0ABS4W6R0_9PSEU|nr:MFS transporter [Pseudonocardia parietis]MBP2371893.1 cyanate permease [Pseudonocardia parietis]
MTERLGSVIGWVTALGSAGISLIPLLLERIVAAEGVRTAWAVQGVAVWVVVVPLALWGLPRRPVVAVSEPQGGTSQHASLGPVLREPMFWVITAGVGVLALVSTALTFHQVDVLGERGLSPAAAAATFLPQTIAGMAATLAAGRLLDRSSPRPVMLGSMAAMAGALALGGYLVPGWQAVLYGGLLGVAGNTFRTVEAAALPRYFGTARIGAVRGLVHAVTVGGSAIGPVLLALGHDIAHTYRPLLLALIVLPAALAVTVLVVREPATAAPACTNSS